VGKRGDNSDTQTNISTNTQVKQQKLVKHELPQKKRSETMCNGRIIIACPIVKPVTKERDS